MALMYCKKCGRFVQGHYNDECEDPYYCDCCESITYKVPLEFLIEPSVPLIKKDLKQQFINEYVKTSPEFDQYLFDHRDEILERERAEYNSKMAIGRALVEEKKRKSKCPSCGSTNVSGIGVLDRALSTYFLGLASSKIGKTHKCNHCGTTW